MICWHVFSESWKTAQVFLAEEKAWGVLDFVSQKDMKQLVTHIFVTQNIDIGYQLHFKAIYCGSNPHIL